MYLIILQRKLWGVLEYFPSEVKLYCHERGWNRIQFQQVVRSSIEKKQAER